MGGRIALHFVAATPNVRAFVGYYPTVRDEPKTEMRPTSRLGSGPDFKCPSLIMFGADETVSPVEVQMLLWKACLENGQRLEWHYFAHGGHGFIDPDAFYEPHAGELAWPLVVDFLQRELEKLRQLDGAKPFGLWPPSPPSGEAGSQRRTRFALVESGEDCRSSKV